MHNFSEVFKSIVNISSIVEDYHDKKSFCEFLCC